MTANLVDAEFFLVSTASHLSEEAVVVEMEQRIADGANIKLNVRFLDEKGQITEYVKELAALECELKAKRHSMASLKGSELRAAPDLRGLAGSIRAIRSRRTQLAAAYVQTRLGAGLDVAIEESNRAFRLIRPNERHECAEAVSQATDVWLFVYQPNDPLALKNTLIASCALVTRMA
ncbi:MAG: hypothetical protein KGI78_03205 [Patescibacteria group bacterium]|nr:hypothetical protein [Patescibacteria group bacterium]MDE2057838.1 hypothetical protein [Patescibacteria group bacterium]